MRKAALVAAVLLGLAVSPIGAWAQAKAQSAALSLTGSSGLSGAGTAASPLACTAAGASAAGCVTTGTQTLAGSKTLSGTLVSTVAGGSDAIELTQGAFMCLKADCTNKIYSSASNNLVIAPQSSKDTYLDITSGAGNLYPNPDNAIGLGGASFRWKDAYIAGDLHLASTKNSGKCTLNNASPSVCTATVVAGSFCVCAPVGTTAVIAAAGCAVSLSSTTLTITGPNTVTYDVNYHCFAP